ncbi:hypothetical protein G6F60_014680 [Rhizopus arrhizus]|nr:hypothetical protein G6F60_014680 [Rhizopus arrhizus]
MCVSIGAGISWTRLGSLCSSALTLRGQVERSVTNTFCIVTMPARLARWMVAPRVDTRLATPISARYSTPPLSCDRPSQLSMLTIANLPARFSAAITGASLRTVSKSPLRAAASSQSPRRRSAR